MKGNTVQQLTRREDEIVSAARAGSPAAFAELHAIYSRRLFNTIIAITGSREDAEDALQDTFMRAYLAIHTFEGRSTIHSWLTRIAINSALMVLRRRRARARIFFDPPADAELETFQFEMKDSEPNPEQAYHLHQLRMKLLRAIGRLGRSLQEPIRMQLVRDSSIEEIARVLNTSEGAIKTRLHRARRRLRAECRSLDLQGGEIALHNNEQLLK
jgi:RNA polymerase sigma-70 factor, ECF subfamily